MIIDWNHVYLLGWFDCFGKCYLTTWTGDMPPVDCVIIGWQPPLWNSPIQNQSIEPMIDSAKTTEEKIEYASQRGGVYAFGWYFKEGNIQRGLP